jgi:hypothetical protein
MITFYLEFNGNTCLSQVNDNPLDVAIKDWLNNYNYENILEFKDIERQDFLSCWKSETPIKIEGLKGVYCMAANVSDYFVILHISGCYW